ncbi:MAG: glycosyltransferase family 2 protein [Caldilineaceae bacterium]|nr:glycosyltransferase family 2 protein [Caldilineaceae bacterium]
MTQEDQDRPTISLVIPIWNEELVIPELYRRVLQIMESIGDSWEMICVNDGSSDRSLELLLALRNQDARVKVLDFSRNFGHQIAITAGSDFAEGDAVIVMDADLQDPPEVVQRMVQKWREGYEVVYAVRTTRQGETKFKLWTARVFYRLLKQITDVHIPLDAGDFRLMDRRVVLTMRRLREQHRFMRGLSSWVGFHQIGVEYERAERYAGETKYPLRKMVRLAISAITSFSYVPLQLATFVGFALATLSLLAIVLTIILRLSGSSFFLGQATTLVSVLFLGGVQLIFLGILGEYLGRIYDEVKNRPLYIVSRAYGFVPDAPAPAGRAVVFHSPSAYDPGRATQSAVQSAVPTPNDPLR